MSEIPFSIVLPCYNEAAGITQILSRFAEVGAGYEFELILVDNGSSDNTQQVLAEELPGYPFARCVTITENRGYGDGLYRGLLSARGTYLAWSHADLQTDPRDVFTGLDVLRKADDPERVIVKGHRQGRALSERFISRGMELVALVLLRRWIPEINAQPKVFHRSLLSCLDHPPPDFNFDVYALDRARSQAWRIERIDVQFPPRQFGESHWAANWRSKVRTILRSVWFMLRLGLGRWR